MYYKHEYFILDTDKRIVSDENDKELRLTGNAYRVLVFLCANKSGTLTDIGNFLDWAKDYNENHLRQYRYKINSLISHDIVRYQNGIYSIEGDIQEVHNRPNIDRNTDLLHEDSVKSKKESHRTNMPKKESKKILIIPAVIAIIVILLSFIDWSSYGYYTFLKFVVTAVAAYYAYFLYTELKEKGVWLWLLVGIAILFNPIVPIYLYDKSVWMAIDVVVIIYFISLIIKFR